MINTNINSDDRPRTPLRHHIEFFLHKYKILSTCDLTVLIHPLLKKDVTFRKLQSSISVTLNVLKNEGEVTKVKPIKWKLVER